MCLDGRFFDQRDHYCNQIAKRGYKDFFDLLKAHNLSEADAILAGLLRSKHSLGTTDLFSVQVTPAGFRYLAESDLQIIVYHHTQERAIVELIQTAAREYHSGNLALTDQQLFSLMYSDDSKPYHEPKQYPCGREQYIKTKQQWQAAMRYWEESVPAYRAFFERVDNGFPRWNDTDKPLCLKDPFADIKPLTFPRMR